MTLEVTQNGTFSASADELWGLVSDFGGLDKIMDGIDGCTTEGEGVGAKRSLSMGGGTVVETLDAFDADGMSLTYSIVEAPLPLKDYSATMVVASDGDGSSLSWTGSFDADGVPDEEAEQLVAGIYQGGIAGFKNALGE